MNEAVVAVVAVVCALFPCLLRIGRGDHLFRSYVRYVDEDPLPGQLYDRAINMTWSIIIHHNIIISKKRRLYILLQWKIEHKETYLACRGRRWTTQTQGGR